MPKSKRILYHVNMKKIQSRVHDTHKGFMCLTGLNKKEIYIARQLKRNGGFTLDLKRVSD